MATVNYELYVLTPQNADHCLEAAKRGNESARHCIRAMAETIAMLGKKRPAQCLCPDCHIQFGSGEHKLPAAMVIAIPMFPTYKDDDPMLVNGVCRNCFNEDTQDDDITRWLAHFGMQARRVKRWQ